jgi:hypothetical protein
MSINAIQPITPSIQPTPLMASMLSTNDQLPNNTLPVDTQGTVQENAQVLPSVTLYNAHGILSKSNPNSLIAYA